MISGLQEHVHTKLLDNGTCVAGYPIHAVLRATVRVLQLVFEVFVEEACTPADRLPMF